MSTLQFEACKVFILELRFVYLPTLMNPLYSREICFAIKSTLELEVISSFFTEHKHYHRKTGMFAAVFFVLIYIFRIVVQLCCKL